MCSSTDVHKFSTSLHTFIMASHVYVLVTLILMIGRQAAGQYPLIDSPGNQCTSVTLDYSIGVGITNWYYTDSLDDPDSAASLQYEQTMCELTSVLKKVAKQYWDVDVMHVDICNVNEFSRYNDGVYVNLTIILSAEKPILGENDYISAIFTVLLAFALADPVLMNDPIGIHADLDNFNYNVNAYNDLQVVGISPIFGPVAGGTKISLQISCKPESLYLYIEDIPCELANNSNNDPLVYIFLSPEAESDGNDDLEQLLFLKIDYGKLTPINKFFTYKPNPVVTGIEPLSALATGGVLLTVSGDHLDFVESTILRVIVVADQNPDDIHSEFNTICHPGEAKSLVCPTPVINLPENRISRRKRQTAELPGYTFYLGLIFDGFDEYKDLRESNKEIEQLAVIADPPRFESWDGIKSVTSAGILLIEGNGLLTGSTVHDYTVGVGDGECGDINMTENRLRCLLPKHSPFQKTEGVIIDGALQVVVYIGHYSNLVGHLAYDSDSGDMDYLNVGLIVGGSLFFALLLAIVVVCCARRCGRIERRKNDRPVNRNPDVVHMGSLQ